MNEKRDDGGWTSGLVSVVPERALVRDCLHCCQGSEGGRYVGFCDRTWNEKMLMEMGTYRVVDAFSGGQVGSGGDASVLLPQRQLIRKITEMGRLMRRIRQLILSQSTDGQKDGMAAQGDGENGKGAGITFAKRHNGPSHRDTVHGVVHGALAAACQKEIRGCYKIIAVLEGQERRDESGVQEPLSLRRVLVWLEEPRQRLEIVLSCLEATANLRGGQVINELHVMSKHGDPFVRDTIKPLLDATCVPYFSQLQQWITRGQFPYSIKTGDTFVPAAMRMSRGASGASLGLGEFMIVKNRTIQDPPLPYDAWTEAFSLDYTAQPRFIDAALAKDIFTVGKAVYFLRHYCNEDDWNGALNDFMWKENFATKPDISTAHRLGLLKSLVAEAKLSMNDKILYIMKEKEQIMRHLEVIKRYVLLSQGDFVRMFIDLADGELQQSIEFYSEYSLQGYVESAIRSCGAGFIDSDIMGGVRVRNTNRKYQFKSEKDIGWDLFGLSYSLPHENSPASVILNATAMHIYGEVSHMLWSIKRAEHMVVLAWNQLDFISRDLVRLKHMQREHGIEPEAVVGKVPMLLRFLHALRTDVAQFIGYIQGDIVYQVIEPAWKGLDADIKGAKDLDSLMEAHKKYLTLLSEGTYSEKKRKNSSQATELKATLQAALRAAIDVYLPVAQLGEMVHKAVNEQAAFLERIKESERIGVWSEEACNSPPPISEDLLSEVKRSVINLQVIFCRHKDTFVAGTSHTS